MFWKNKRKQLLSLWIIVCTGLKLDDFTFRKVIGKGGFGTVRVASLKSSGKHYAIKSINVGNEKNEIEVFQHISDSPFMVRYYAHFFENHQAHLVLEFCEGGDFITILNEFGRLDENTTRFYLAEVFLALQRLHRNNYILRDLKPDNILLAKDGHIRLTDFGLTSSLLETKQLPKRLTNFEAFLSLGKKENRLSLDALNHKRRRLMYSVKGTVSYMAPEILSGEGYDDKVDWWSYGAIMYEMLYGISPYDLLKSRKKSGEPILLSDFTCELPYNDRIISKDANDLIKGLLCCREKRYNDVEIKRHPFFVGLDWNKVIAMQYLPPLIPNLSSGLDFSYFPVDELQEESLLPKF